MLVSNHSEDTEVRIDGALQAIADNGVIHHQGSNPCNSIVSSESYAINRSLLTCGVQLSVSGAADIKVLNLMHLLPDSTVEVDLTLPLLTRPKRHPMTVI